jgi:hypothetical protein
LKDTLFRACAHYNRACHLPAQTKSFGFPLNVDSPMILSTTCLMVSGLP